MNLIGENLSVSLGRRRVLTDCTVEIPAGRVVALVGPSGSVKTTLLWALAGLRRADCGSIRIGDGAADFRKPRIGMVFQQSALWDHLTVRAHLKLVLAGGGLSAPQRDERIDAMLSRLDLSHLAGRRPGRLSGGERRRLSIARALIIEPQWLLLDEPLAHLDGSARTELFAQLREQLDETRAGVLMATHNAPEAMRIAQHSVILIDGRIVQSGPTEDVYRNPVSLAAARVLGEADEWPAGAGRIVRPEGLTFKPDPQGDETVTACEFAGSAFLLTVRGSSGTVRVRSHRPQPAGTTGRVSIVSQTAGKNS